MFLKAFAIPAVLLGLAPQPLATPPMKMGLWELSSTVTSSGSQAPDTPTVHKLRVCLTPESWARSFQGPMVARGGCQLSNEKATASSYSLNWACPGYHATGHVQMTFSSSESGHGTSHIEAEINGTHINTVASSDMHFVSRDCGSVSPDHPQVLP